MSYGALMERANHKFVSCPAVDLCDGVGWDGWGEGHISGVNTCTCLPLYTLYYVMCSVIY